MPQLIGASEASPFLVFNVAIALGLLFCTVDGLTTVYFINNEVDLAVNEIMHQLQYQHSYNKDL